MYITLFMMLFTHTYTKNHVPSMLAKGVETINKQTQQTSSHTGVYKIHKIQPQRA